MADISNTELVASLAVLSFGQVIYPATMPPVQSVLVDGTEAKEVKHGHLTSIVGVLTIASALSYWARSPYPLYVGALTIVVMSGIYQYTLDKVV